MIEFGLNSNSNLNSNRFSWFELEKRKEIGKETQNQNPETQPSQPTKTRSGPWPTFLFPSPNLAARSLPTPTQLFPARPSSRGPLLPRLPLGPSPRHERRPHPRLSRCTPGSTCNRPPPSFPTPALQQNPSSPARFSPAPSTARLPEIPGPALLNRSSDPPAPYHPPRSRLKP